MQVGNGVRLSLPTVIPRYTHNKSTRIRSRRVVCATYIISPSQNVRNAHLNAMPTVQLRSCIKVKADAASSTFVEVDNIVDALTTPINNPVMSIKRRRVSHQAFPPCFRGKLLAVASKGYQLRSTASFASPSFFPFLDLLPCLFIDSVVYRHDAVHVGRIGLVTFPFHGIEEHFLTRVYPISGFCIVARVSFVVCR